MRIFFVILFILFPYVSFAESVKSEEYKINYFFLRKDNDLSGVKFFIFKIKTKENIENYKLCKNKGKDVCYFYINEKSEIKKNFDIVEVMKLKEYNIFNVDLKSKDALNKEFLILDILPSDIDKEGNIENIYQVRPFKDDNFFDKYFFSETNSVSISKKTLSAIKNVKSTSDCILKIDNLINVYKYLGNIDIHEIDHINIDYWENNNHIYSFSCEKNKGNFSLEVKEFYNHYI